MSIEPITIPMSIETNDVTIDSTFDARIEVVEGGSITVQSLTVLNNGTTVAPEGKAYSPVVVNVPNTYSVSDEGKVVKNGALTSQTTTTASANGDIDTTTIKKVTVAVPASAVDSGTKNITSNGDNQDVVGYAKVNVAVPNSYSAADEGKVVSSGALVSQTSDTVTANDTYDTTLINSLTVNVSGGGGYTLKEELFGYSPSGDVVYIPDEDIPRYGIRGKRGMTKLTIDFQNGYGFAHSNNNGYNIQSNDIPVYVIIGHDSGVMLRGYTLNSNGSSFILVCRGCYFGSSGYSASALRGNAGMTTLDFTFSDGNGFQQNSLYGNSSLKTVIIRGSSVMSLAATNVFTQTPFASGGSGGTLYVPNSLISSYQSASNWGTILGYTNNQIKSIESTHTDPTAPIDLTLYYADGTPIS